VLEVGPLVNRDTLPFDDDTFDAAMARLRCSGRSARIEAEGSTAVTSRSSGS